MRTGDLPHHLDACQCGAWRNVPCAPSSTGARAGADEELLLLRLLAQASGEATDLSQALSAVLQAVCHATGWLTGQIWLPHADDQSLEPGPAWHRPCPQFDSLDPVAARAMLRRDEGLAGTAWSSGQLQWARGTRAADGAAVAIPVWSGDAVVAVLEFFGHPQSQDESRLRGLLLVIAAQVGVLLKRKQIEQELQQAEVERTALLATEQERARRLHELSELKADFTAMVAHELAGPLAAIRGLADALATGDLSAEQRASTIATIQAEARLLTALVADVQTAASTERDDFDVRIRSWSVAALLVEAVAAGRSLPGDHPLSVVAPAPDAVVRADPERIGQVLRNLLGNAAKFSPAGAPIELRATVSRTHVRIEVADCGFGIRAEDLTRIFEKFGRGRDRHGQRVAGAGLGLYLSRRIVRMHGSELTVLSSPGAGAVFGFDLQVVP